MSNSINRLDISQSPPARSLMTKQDALRKALAEFEIELEQAEAYKDVEIGTLSLKTDATSGELTIVGHTLATGKTFDILFSGGSRTGVLAGSVAGNVIQFSGGTGNDLPAQDAAITAIHWNSFSQDYKAKTAAGSVDADVGRRVMNELLSERGAIQAAIKQASSQIISI